MTTKKQIVDQLEETAQLLDLLGEDAFRAKAFQNAARQLDSFEGNFDSLWQERRLTDIRGIGKTLASELYMLDDDHELIPSLESLHQKIPESVRSLFRVAGLGPKKIGLLWQQGIDSLSKLLEAARDGRVATLKGFGAKSAEKILESVSFVLASQSRMRLDVAEAYSLLIQQHLSLHFPEATLEVAGEYRRNCETVNEIAFVITGVTLTELRTVLEALAHSLEVQDNTVTAGIENHTLRITLCVRENFGTTLVFKTGSADYVAALQHQASLKGFDLTSEGLYQQGKKLDIHNEDTLYKTLGLPYLTPELRESSKLEYPQRLVNQEDIRGMVHNHSTWSDAQGSIREMVRGAQARGYSYLAMADHSKTSYYANGLSIERVLEQAKEIKTIQQELKDQGSDFQLLHGMEVDILSDGSLDYPDEILAMLDYTVVSIHQHFTLSEKDQTARIIKAVQHPYASILGHMTGRLLLRRPPYAVDIQAVIEACAAHNTIVEINANPYRLDLDWRWVIKAKNLGCKFSINPDAHAVTGFEDIRFGVMMGRKAGLSPEDVVNTAPTAQGFLAQLKRRP